MRNCGCGGSHDSGVPSSRTLMPWCFLLSLPPAFLFSISLVLSNWCVRAQAFSPPRLALALVLRTAHADHEIVPQGIPLPHRCLRFSFREHSHILTNSVLPVSYIHMLSACRVFAASPPADLPFPLRRGFRPCRNSSRCVRLWDQGVLRKARGHRLRDFARDRTRVVRGERVQLDWLPHSGAPLTCSRPTCGCSC